MYQTGDMVVHPGHGGCIVQGVCERKFGGEARRYYVLVPKSEPGTTILDPVDNVSKIGLRNVISPEQADELLQHVADVGAEWQDDNAKRRQAYDEILKAGNLQLMAQMIKELTLQSQSKALNQHDKDLLPRAQKKLLSEIALAKGIDFEGALGLLNDAIAVS